MRLTSTEMAARRRNIADKWAFPLTAAVKRRVVTQSDTGAELESYETITGMSAIKCFMTTKAVSVTDLNGAILTDLVTRIKFDGYYDTIKPEMIISISGTEYEVRAVDNGSAGLFTTCIVGKRGA